VDVVSQRVLDALQGLALRSEGAGA
jgi:hypothetical protein